MGPPPLEGGGWVRAGTTHGALGWLARLRRRQSHLVWVREGRGPVQEILGRCGMVTAGSSTIFTNAWMGLTGSGEECFRCSYSFVQSVNPVILHS